jgi:polysaccharide export outer membrane protein
MPTVTRRIWAALLFASWLLNPVRAEVPVQAEGYRLQPGDVIHVAVWKEEDLKLDAVVGPDGGISMPLIGDVKAAGLTVGMLREELTKRFAEYIPDVSLSVYIRQLLGYKVYVMGKVNHPGEFVLNQDVDVIQALSKAGGLTPYAARDEIRIIRRSGDRQQVFPFQYKEVEKGRQLEQNIILKSGDIILVP